MSGKTFSLEYELLRYHQSLHLELTNARPRMFTAVSPVGFCEATLLEVKFLPSRLVSLSVLQAPLKGSVCSAMRTVLRSYTDVCDAVFVLEIGLRLLAKTGGDPQGQLLSYLTDSLQMDSQISSSVAKVETSKPTDISITTLLCKEC